MEKTAYDDVAYGGVAYPIASPNRLAGIARLMGVAAASPRTARVLDLGCGEGRNTVPLAWYWPQAQFLGLDLAPTPIDAGMAKIRQLELANVELRQADVASLEPASLGQFDFVIAHGLFSWVPEPVRIATLRLIGGVLEPDGVAYVSYNAMPGTRIRHVARDLLRFQLRGQPYTPAIIEPAWTLLQSVVALPDDDQLPFLGTLQTESKNAMSVTPEYLFHDDLSPENQPYYLHEFAAMAAEHGLAWFADADASSMAEPQNNPAVEAWIRQVSAGSPMARQQCLDFLNGYRFNRSLLCRADRAPPGGFVPEAVAAARWFTTLTPVGEVRVDDASEAKFSRIDGKGASTNHGVIKLALTMLAASPSRTITTAELAERLTVADDNAPARIAAAGHVMLRLLQSDLVSAVAEPFEATGPSPLAQERLPALSRLARMQLASATAMVDNAHYNINLSEPWLDPVLEAFDGSLSVARARERFVQAYLSSRAPEPDAPQRNDRHAEANARFEWIVAMLAHRGLFAAR